MPASLFAGTWVFERELSQLNSPPPEQWIQHISTNNDRIQVKETITRSTETTTVEVDAAPDGAFYPVIGSPVADEISYSIDGNSIIGLARKSGVISLRETIDFSETKIMTMSMTLVINSKEIVLGTAHFRKANL
jgi:hypothetical protein